jgi:hypothetical protein
VVSRAHTDVEAEVAQASRKDAPERTRAADDPDPHPSVFH